MKNSKIYNMTYACKSQSLIGTSDLIDRTFIHKKNRLIYNVCCHECYSSQTECNRNHVTIKSIY